MGVKKIGGIRVCDCDHRFKPVICRTRLENPFYYYVQCGNCGKRGAPALHKSWDSHILGQREAISLWNDRKFMSGDPRSLPTS